MPRSKATFPCGHPRTPENTRVAGGRGRTWTRCRKCNNEYMRSYMRRRNRQRMIRRAVDLAREKDRARAARER
jgi:hypothetical protein